MSTINYCGTKITTEQRAAGISAARDVFAAHGRAPSYCYAQSVAQANGEEYDAPAHQTWWEAELAALNAIDLLDGDASGCSLVWEG